MSGGYSNLQIYGRAQAFAAMIEVQGLSFRHRGAKHDTLCNLNFQVKPGELVCLTGQNGSGKSTLLNILSGVYSPNSGNIKIRINNQHKAHIELVPQDPDIYILGSLVEEDLTLTLPPDDAKAYAAAMEWAKRFGLGDFLKEPVQTLSFGQKKKLSLASALSAAPDLLLLDEPFSGLDYPSAKAMRAALTEHKNLGLTQIVCEHDLDLLADLADSFILINEGKLVSSGPWQSVFPFMENNGVRPPCWWYSHQGITPWWKKA